MCLVDVGDVTNVGQFLFAEITGAWLRVPAGMGLPITAGGSS